MSQLLDLLQGSFSFKVSRSYSYPSYSFTLLKWKSSICHGNYGAFQKFRGVKYSLQGSSDVVDRKEIFSIPNKDNVCYGEKLSALPLVRTLGDLPKVELLGKVVMVRFDSTILLRANQVHKTPSVNNRAVSTIKYLFEAGANVILVSSWTAKNNSKLLTAESVAEQLSSLLQLGVVLLKTFPGATNTCDDGHNSRIYLLENLFQSKLDLANSSKFAEELSSGVDIFVNDDFFQSHKMLASTIGITSFCYASVAGFHFEESLCQLKEAFATNRKRYVAIIGGDNLLDKEAALLFLVSSCDGLIFVGNMAFQIMHALGLPVPRKLVENGALETALKIIQISESRSIPLLFPKDFWCMTGHLQKPLELHSASDILDGWSPVAMGPKSLNDITSLLSKCEKILWIGAVKFGSSNHDSEGASIMAQTLNKLCLSKCDVTVVGNIECKAFMGESSSPSVANLIESASVVWAFLKGRKLPGLMALDRAYPFAIDWNSSYTDPAQPLVVDIGSGNGLFLFGMAYKRKDLNFLGLEMNGRLVKRCIDSVHQYNIKNGHFIETNATSTFRSIVSSYPGEVVLVSIQCPNPDFRKPEHRWRMLQRSLVEAIVDLLSANGKVFLQSDIEAVAVRMKEQFMKYGKGKLAITSDQDDPRIGQREWLESNPFGVESDWEKHVLRRGAPMYRLMLSKRTIRSRSCSLQCPPKRVLYRIGDLVYRYCVSYCFS